MKSRNLRTRRRPPLAAAAMLLAVSALTPAQAHEPPAGREDAEDAHAAHPDAAVERLRTQVHAEAQRLRAELDARETGRDWSELLERKCTVDAAFSPVHFLFDALEWGGPPGSPAGGPDLLRSVRAEWREEPVIASWSHPDAPERIRRSLAAWVPVDAGDGAAGEVRWLHTEVRTGSERWVRGDAPVVMRWTVDADRREGRPTVHARCWWRVPLAEPRHVDFPLPGDGFDIWVDRTGARYADDRGGSHDERWEGTPIFNNPPELYAAFDSLRLVAAKDRTVQDRPPARDAECPPEGGADGEHVTRTRRVLRNDGSPVRIERWNWERGRLRSVVIEQEALRLVHHAEQGAEIVTEMGGIETGRTPHRATSELVHFPAGARIDIAFRDADPGRDRVAGNPATETVPDRLLLTVAGARVAWAEFNSVQVRRTEDLATDASAELHGESEGCRAVAATLGRSIEQRSATAFREAVGQVAAQHALLGVPNLQRACEWELIAARARRAGMDAEADQVIVGRLLAEAAEDAEAIVRRARERGEGSFAERLAQIAGIDAVPASAGSGPGPEVAEPIRADACRCDRSLLGEGARTLFEALLRELRDAGMPRDAAREVEDALCRELMATDTAMGAHLASNASWIASEARAVLRSTRGPGAGATFARLARAAAEGGAGGAAGSAAARYAWDACAEGVQAALRSAIARGGISADRELLDAVAVSVHGAMQSQRAFIGNPFVPELQRAGRDDPPGVDAIRRRLMGAVEAACGRELRRAATARDLLGGSLADAREEAARRRIARDLVGLATGEYLEWSSGSGGPSGPGA